ncbi:MAG: NnrS family protein [Proteobacteria bacterium]|nr:NnrS family protein [Pseudomonadota bacterium]
MPEIPLPSAIQRAPLPFRPLFLCAGAFATLGMLAWGLFLHLGWNPSATLIPIAWHAHAMLYGFAGALVGGFVLTASGHWTGIATTNRSPLAVATLAWAAARFALWLGAPLWLAAALDAGYLALVAVLVGRVVFLSGNRRNFFLVAILLGYVALDLWFYAAVARGDYAQVTRALLVCVDLLTLLMIAIGGRVIPFFTGRKLPALKMAQWTPLTVAVNLGAAIVLLLDFVGIDLRVRGACMLVLAVLVLLRLLGWRGWRTLHEPMLWVLHLGYLWLAVGLALRGLGLLGLWSQAEVETLHGITVGALGTLSLGMMTRVSLGHSGREIRANAALVVAFALPTLAAVLRLAIGTPGWLWAACAWMLAFGIWLVVMTPVLLRGLPKRVEAVRT